MFLSIIISDIGLDLTKLQVGKTYKIEFKQNDLMITVLKALIKNINVEKNYFEFEPLVDENTDIEEFYIDINKPMDIKLKDSNGDALIKL
jgi:predicted RNA-binding protein associated with RNAse of E/G family